MTNKQRIEEIKQNLHLKMLNVWSSDGFEEREEAIKKFDIAVNQSLTSYATSLIEALEDIPDFLEYGQDTDFENGFVKGFKSSKVHTQDIIKKSISSE